MYQPIRRRILSRVLWSLGLLAWAGALRADVIHNNENIGTPTTWLAADGNHIVQGSVWVNSTLTIEAGCNVIFAGGASLRVFGELVADGSASSIYFGPQNLLLFWAGIIFDPGSIGTFDSCTIEYALQSGASAIQVQNASVSLQGCTLRNNLHAIKIMQGNAGTLSGNLIQNNSIGLYFQDVANLSLTQGNTIQGHATGLIVENCSNVTIDNQSISTTISGEGAISVRGSGGFHLGAGNSISSCEWPLTIDADSHPDPASLGNIPTTGNTNDAIQVNGGSTNRPATWSDFGIPYVVTDSPWFLGAADLQVAEGVVVLFDSLKHIRVWGNMDAIGGLSGITFTRRTSSVYWRGILFEAGSTGTLQNCLIEFIPGSLSGAVSIDGANVSLENCRLRFSQIGVSVRNGAQFAISDCSFVQNFQGLRFENVDNLSLTTPNLYQQNGHGITVLESDDAIIDNQWIDGSADNAVLGSRAANITIGAGNSFTNNEFVIGLHPDAYLSSASTGNLPEAGNVNDGLIRVYGGNTVGDIVWHDLGATYRVTGNLNVLAGHSMTIEGGIRIEVDPGPLLRVWGTLNVLADIDPTDFRHVAGSPGWAGIQFESGSVGRFENCLIRFALFAAGQAISAVGSASVEVIGSTISSNLYGVRGENGAQISLTGCVVSQNNFGVHLTEASATLLNTRISSNIYEGLFLSGASIVNFGSSPTEWNDIYGNAVAEYHVDFANGTADIDAQYVYWGSTDPGAIEVTIEHKPDDGNRGLVTYNPWLNAQHDSEFGSPFVDVTPALLLEPTSASGVAWGDYDNDGDPDLYVAGSGPNKLFENIGGNFVDSTPGPLADTGDAFGAEWVDVNDDGWLDLALTNFGGDVLVFLNFGSGIWIPVQLSDDRSWTVRFADINGDGKLDFARSSEAGNVSIALNYGAFFGEVASIEFTNPHGLGWADYNDDGKPDLAIGGSSAGDARWQLRMSVSDPEQSLYQWNLNLQRLDPQTNFFMALAWGDADADGDLDLYVGGANGPDDFACASGSGAMFCSPTGTGDAAWPISAAWGDFDNDGLLDLFICDEDTTNHLLRNSGSLAFVRVTDPTVDLAGNGDSGGVAWADYDGDGDLDLFIASKGGSNALLRNESPGTNHWFQVGLKGAASNAFGHGAKIRVYADDATRMHEVGTGAGWLAGNPLTAHFGLGGSASIDSVVVDWPASGRRNYGFFAADQRVTLEEDTSTAVPELDAPTRVSLAPGSPNPFGASTRFELALPRTTHVRLEIFDVAGRRVRKLRDAMLPAGRHQILWDGADDRGRSVSSGSYHLRLQAGDLVRTQPIVRIR